MSLSLRGLLFRRILPSIFWINALGSLSTQAASDRNPDAHGAFSLYIENDSFVGTDRYYTSGVKLGWSSPDLEKFSDSPYAKPFLRLFDALPYINQTDYQKNLLFTLGQNIYTPVDTQSRVLIPDDRPYAGWLYLGLGVVWKTAKVRNTLALNVGVVGSWSYAQKTQSRVHDLLGDERAKGWDNQLHNELGALLVYSRDWRWPERIRRKGLNWELLPHAGLAVGNVRSYADFGGELRVGFNLPDDFGTATIDPASSTSTPVEGSESGLSAGAGNGLYFFGRADGRFVAHNIFLDGNTFGNSHSVDRKWLVADLSVGVAANRGNTKFAYALVYRTEEFRGQKHPQIFGTVSVNFAFH